MKFGAFTKKYRDTDTDFQGGGPMQEETKSWERLQLIAMQWWDLFRQS